MLFSPFSFAGLTLKNRIVRAATYEKLASEDGFVTDPIIALYERLALGGSGLLITGNALIHPSGRAQPRMLSIHSDSCMPGLRRLTDAVHKSGGLIAIQLNHGGRQSPPILLGGRRPIGPSAVYNPLTEVMPSAMTDAEIWSIIDAFGEAGRRAALSGFDAIEIHGAHGYLISSFLSPYTNRRDDYWGGDEERRFHFAEEVFKTVTTAGLPVLMKINSDDFIEGGLKPEESLRIAKRLDAMGLSAIEISGGMRESALKPARPDILKPEDEAYFRGAATLFKRTLSVPVVLTGGLRSRAVMEDVLESGAADLIGMSRPLIREPDLPRLMQEEGKARADCISCLKCMRFSRLSSVRCMQTGANRDI